MNVNKTENGSVVLYGVSKVEYGPNGCTPYPMCVKSCANYLGQDVSLDFTMAATGAAFRLTWDTTSWNGGNVDIIHTFDSPEETYKLGIEALGRDFQIITRTNTPCDVKFASRNNSNEKSDFIKFIKTEIDKGFPCIALGIIGPPEACIVTGYRENGETLLGWNFFQDFTEFATDIKMDESGYFISSKWWDNNDTIALISLGEKDKPLITNKAIIVNAIKVMTGRHDIKAGKTFAKGISAYDAWRQSILDESSFPPNAILPILAERLMCQGDAMDCLIDGRRNAAIFIKKLSEKLPQHGEICVEIERQFTKVTSIICKMADILGGYSRDEKQMRNFAKTEIRLQIANLIYECKIADNKALEALWELVTYL